MTHTRGRAGTVKRAGPIVGGIAAGFCGVGRIRFDDGIVWHRHGKA